MNKKITIQILINILSYIIAVLIGGLIFEMFWYDYLITGVLILMLTAYEVYKIRKVVK